MNKKIILYSLSLLLATLFWTSVHAQSSGDYRSNGNVKFTSAANWQLFNGTTWVNAVKIPPLNSGTTTIMHYLIIDTNIKVAGTLNIGATVGSTISPTVNISGNMNMNTGSSMNFSGTINVLSGGTMNVIGQTNLTSGNLNIAGNFIVSSTGQSYCSVKIVILAGGIITNNNTFQSNTSLEINGILQTNGKNFYNGGSTVVNNGGQLIYNQDGTTGNIPISTWNSGSTLKITGIVTTLPQNLNQSFYNFTWDCAAQGQDLSLNDIFKTVNGNLSFTNTNGKNLQIFNTTANTLSVAGNLSVSGNTKVVLGGIGTSIFLLNVNGNFTQSGGTLDLGNGINAMNLKGNFTSSGGKVVRTGGTAKINFCGTTTQYYSSSNLTESSNGLSIEVANNSALILSSNMNVLGSRTNTYFYVYGSLDMNNYNISVNYNYEVFPTGILKTGTGIISTPDTTLNTFIIDSGGRIYIGSPNGITASSLSGNIQTKGTRTYNPGSNYIYNGIVNQIPGNGLPAAISGSLTFQNSNTIVFNSNQTVSGSIVMYSGLINMGTGTLTLSNTAISSLTYTAGYIKGKFQRAIGSKTIGKYIFPLGQDISLGRMLTLNILLSGSSSDGSLTAEFIAANAGGLNVNYIDNGYILNVYSKDGYWNLTPVTITGINYGLSLEAKSFLGIQSPQKLRILERIDSAWSVQGNNVIGTGTVTDPIISRTNLSSFGDYIIASNSSDNTLDEILSVELQSFTSVTNNNKVTLNWVTANENDNLGFDIERSDYRNANWTKIGFVMGIGNSNTTNYYRYYDAELETGTYSYRLKQIDFNGNFVYYNLQNKVIINDPSKFSLSQNYPNPFNPATRIEFRIVSQSDVSLKVYDMTGRLITTLLDNNLPAGYYQVDFDGSNFSSGLYSYILKSGDKVDSKKMLYIK
ncbi:MAG: hypothetical protein PHN88_02960 [Ignavibacteria bacterium]|nr:hypothetical protein [Ignavibacteria bacterium]